MDEGSTVGAFQWRDGNDVAGFRGRPLRTRQFVALSGKVAAETWYAREPESEERCSWHTWDVNGVGGENSSAESPVAAESEAMAALCRQREANPEKWHGARAPAAPLDLDAIEARAKRATSEPEADEDAGHICAECHDTFYVDGLDPSPLCDGCAHAVADALGTDALALVARIRELEAKAARERRTSLLLIKMLTDEQVAALEKAMRAAGAVP